MPGMYPGAIWNPDAGLFPPMFLTSAARLAITLRAGEVCLDAQSGQMYIGDGVTPGGVESLPLSNSNPQNSLVPAGYATYIPGAINFAAGVKVEIAAGAIVEVG